MSDLKSSIERKTDHIYYNMALTNNNLSDSLIANFSETRGQAILDKPEDWHASVIRFSVPTDNIWLFQMDNLSVTVTGTATMGSEVITGVTVTPDPSASGYNLVGAYLGAPCEGYILNYNATTHVINLYTNATGTGAFSSTIYLTPYYILMEDDDAGTYAAVVQVSPSITPNRDPTLIYKYQEFIDQTNTALLDCFNLIKAQGFGGTHAPYIYLDPITKLFSIVFENNEWFPQNPTGATLYFNPPMSLLYAGLPADPSLSLINVTGGAPALFNSVVNCISTGQPGNYVASVLRDPNGGSGYAATVMTAEFSSLYNWQDLVKVVIRSSTLPTEYEYLPSSIAVTDNNVPIQAQQQQSFSNTAPIISDFLYPESSSGFDRTAAQYIPTAEYRLLSLKSGPAMYRFSAQMFWEDKNQVQRPIYLGPGQSASIKLLFRRRKDAF